MKPSLLITIFDDDPENGGFGGIAKLLEALGEAATRAFGFAVSQGSPEPLPPGAFDSRRRQYAAVELLASLARRGESGLVVLGVTGADLFAPRLNFVFGMADRTAGTAVISLHRLTPDFYGEAPDPVLARERAAKEAIHEIGHVLGLDHCTSNGCIMRFSSAIMDTDEKGPGFCGRCSAKLGPLAAPE
ncbi:MAG: archaemetzincin family Zn-dependent metalloprotease [Actinobacteria bacterium]|nr:archaemetzincin family Zn-dependent metalloprotease [Actinomycetota bacterium]